MKIPPNTATFTYFNANPKNRQTPDCVVRAVSVATGIDYVTTARNLLEFALKQGYDPDEPRGFGRYLESLGWTRHRAPRDEGNHRVRCRDFVQSVNTTCVISISDFHISLIKGSKIVDTWDCSDYFVGVYWTPPDTQS